MVKVKKLGWLTINKWEVLAKLVTPGYIKITQRENGFSCCFSYNGWYAFDYWVDKSFPTLDEAKAAAQADYEARILSALEP